MHFCVQKPESCAISENFRATVRSHGHSFLKLCCDFLILRAIKNLDLGLWLHIIWKIWACSFRLFVNNNFFWLIEKFNHLSNELSLIIQFLLSSFCGFQLKQKSSSNNLDWHQPPPPLDSSFQIKTDFF